MDTTYGWKPLTLTQGQNRNGILEKGHKGHERQDSGRVRDLIFKGPWEVAKTSLKPNQRRECKFVSLRNLFQKDRCKNLTWHRSVGFVNEKEMVIQTSWIKNSFALYRFKCLKFQLQMGSDLQGLNLWIFEFRVLQEWYTFSKHDAMVMAFRSSPV